MTATASESSSPPASSGDGMRPVYWVIAVVVLLAAIIGLFAYNANEQTEAAEQKAVELTQAFEQAGLTVPADTERIARSLGTDGGAVCENPATALGKATLADAMTNGGSFVGRRAVIVDPRLLKGEALILQVYCPDKLQPYQAYIDSLKTDTTLGD
jgi:hypothetical protein